MAACCCLTGDRHGVLLCTLSDGGKAMSDSLNILMLAGAFALLFAVAEILYRVVHMPAEVTRKIVHIGTGCLTLLFPFLLHGAFLVGLLCGISLLILLLSLRYHWLPSINAIGRKSWGSL